MKAQEGGGRGIVQETAGGKECGEHMLNRALAHLHETDCDVRDGKIFAAVEEGVRLTIS